jgi:DinB superfamily
MLMGATQPHPEIKLLLVMIDQAYDKKAWHGPNLKGSIRGLTAAQGAWRPKAGRRSIAEIVLHAAYWKYIVRRRLRGDKRGSFPLKGSNWFAVPASLPEAAWHDHVSLLDAEHVAMRAVIAELPHKQLHYRPSGSKFSHLTQITGIAAHDLYHAGQIQLLKRLQRG